MDGWSGADRLLWPARRLPVAPIPYSGSLGSVVPHSAIKPNKLSPSLPLSFPPPTSAPTSSCSFTGSQALEVEHRGSQYRQHLLCFTILWKGLYDLLFEVCNRCCRD